MTVHFSDALRNARADVVESTMGASALLRIYSGSLPANTSAAPGTLLSEIALPSDWMAAASGGAKAKSGTWKDDLANASGTAGYWRLYRSDGTTCDAQGDISTVAAGTGSMQLVSTSLVQDLPFTVNTFGWTEGNAGS